MVQLHRDTFGAEPIITGAEFWNDTPIINRIIDAIDAGVPYVEKDVEDGVDV